MCRSLVCVQVSLRGNPAGANRDGREASAGGGRKLFRQHGPLRVASKQPDGASTRLSLSLPPLAGLLARVSSG